MSTTSGHEVGRLARLAAQRPAGSVSPGVHTVGSTLVAVPPEPGPHPVLVMLHGSGATPEQSLDLVWTAAERRRTIVVAPASDAYTWDLLVGGFGPDVETIERSLEVVASSSHVDVDRVFIGGFSDGASYALSLGLANGDLFTRVLAFSPGFMAPPSRVGRPPVFISHGRDDQVLRVAATSRRIVAQLEYEGYDVRYEEFDGGHGVPPDLVESALDEAA